MNNSQPDKVQRLCSHKPGEEWVEGCCSNTLSQGENLPVQSVISSSVKNIEKDKKLTRE